MLSDEELQEWEEKMAMRFREPNLEERFHGGRIWRRSRPKVCPQCGATFYAWQADDNPMRPGSQDENPSHGRGTRETCGSLHCHESEDETQWKERVKWRENRPNAVLQKQDHMEGYL